MSNQKRLILKLSVISIAIVIPICAIGIFFSQHPVFCLKGIEYEDVCTATIQVCGSNQNCSEADIKRILGLTSEVNFELFGHSLELSGGYPPVVITLKSGKTYSLSSDGSEKVCINGKWFGCKSSDLGDALDDIYEKHSVG